MRRSAALLLGLGMLACREDPKPRPVVETCAPGLEAPCQRECEAGIDKSCEVLMTMYLQGNGVTRSREKAASLNRRLCEKGRKYFCPSFAFALYEGDGIARDRERALLLFRAHCQDDPKACSEFGNLYFVGLGVEKNLAMGCLLAGLACRHGDREACAESRRYCAGRDGAMGDGGG